MARDYSRFLQLTGATPAPRPARSPLQTLGWSPFFSQQTSVDQIAATPPVRVTEVHRSGLRALGDGLDTMIPPGLDATVGDWLLYDPLQPARSTVLRRKSLFARRAPGDDRRRQLIAANIDTVFIVSSCNREFNVARLERYVALAFEAEVTPVILLTKADLCPDTAPFLDAARSISGRLIVEAIDARSDAPVVRLAQWCAPGQTIAFLGSSGVGKSTLVNALMAHGVAETAAIRAEDDRGRHTTTQRQLHLTAGGCAVVDTPGMREIQLTDVEAGIADLFADIVDLEADCRFRDCRHDSEPGCAVLDAVARGHLDPARLARWRKLAAEERFNASSLAGRKRADKSLHKTIKRIQKDKR